jgi:diguanylate cyclase (GGDEF)-like protein
LSEIVEQLADLTATRDRDLLDLALASALRQALGAQVGIVLWRVLAADDASHWYSRVRWPAGAAVPQADSVWTPPQQRPRLADWPSHRRCYETELPVALEAEGPGHGLLWPWRSEREAMGVLEFSSPQPLGDAEQRLLAGVLRIHANLLALLDHAERDTLTGLLNRKTYDEAFLRCASTRPQQAADMPCAVLAVLDIDHFKRVNDGFGHLIGDEVLLLMARLMRACFRQHDGLYRFGGEEFVVLMRCRHAGEAAAALERLRAAVQAYSFPQVGQITVSIGYTELVAGDTPAAAFERADKAVYFAKGAGRNQVRGFEALLAQGELQAAAKTGDVELF